jgi:hypothetical protein
LPSGNNISKRNGVIVRNKKTSAEVADLKRVERGEQEPSQSTHKELIIMEILVEAAGVEPASEGVTGQETTCLFAFMLPAFTGNVRGPRSERTRNVFR